MNARYSWGMREFGLRTFDGHRIMFGRFGERHPAGDEIVCLLSGDVKMVLDRGGAEEVAGLRDPGSYVVVPKGTWHTARTSVPTRMLFVTPGEGTENKPV